MMRPRTIISSTRSWLPLLLQPHKLLRNIVECFSSYDALSWSDNLELFNSGINLALDILLPAILLSLVGSCLPSLSVSTSIGDSVIRTKTLPSCIDVLSPYTLHSMALSSSSIESSIPLFIHRPLLSNFDPVYLLRLTVLSIISPISIDVLFRHFTPILMQALSRLRVVLKSRKGPDKSTKVALLEQVKAGRVLQRHGYDLYLPPPTAMSIGNTKKKFENNNSIIKSLLFFPGFGIHHEAYADVAIQISEYGIPVVVVSLEPLRLAHAKFVGSMDDVRRITKSASKDVVLYYKRNHLLDSTDVLYDKDNPVERKDESIVVEWEMSGHSMGGYCALQLAEDLVQSKDVQSSIKLKDGSVLRIGSNIVVWAAGNIVDIVPYLQSPATSSPSPLRVLILLGSNDNIAKFTSHQHKRQLLSRLPRRSKMETIKGANHSGFASYDEACEKSSTFLMNGPRDITLKSQHEQASRRTVNFLVNTK